MIGYKHINPNFAWRFMYGESVALGTFSYYREWDDPRADREEGYQLHDIEGTFEGGSPQAGWMQENMHITLGEGLPMSFHNIGMRNVFPDYLIFCFSRDPDFKFAAKERLWIVEFDVGLLLKDIVRAAPIIGWPAVDNVAYDKERGCLRRNSMPVSNPFKKPPSFAWENETRALFQRYASRRQQVFLKAPNASSYTKLLHNPLL